MGSRFASINIAEEGRTSFWLRYITGDCLQVACTDGRGASFAERCVGDCHYYVAFAVLIAHVALEVRDNAVTRSLRIACVFIIDVEGDEACA